MRKVHLILVLLTAWGTVFSGEEFTDYFERSDGPLEEWYEFFPATRLEGGRLALEATEGQQPVAWAGRAGEPVYFDNLDSIEFSIEFGNIPGDAVGRHGGLLFCGTSPSERYQGNFSGYFLDWIDRTGDHGFRIHRVEGGQHTALFVGTEHAEPPSSWKVVMTETGFELHAEEELVCSIEDTTYRSGYVGFWCYSNAGQLMYVDDVVIKLSPGDCPHINPRQVFATVNDPGLEFALEAPFGSNDTEAYTVSVKSTAPEVAAPAGATEGIAEVVFEAGASREKDLTVNVLSPGKAELELSVGGKVCEEAGVDITVLPEPDTTFTENFEGEPDGIPIDFAVHDEEVQVEDESLVLRASLPGVEPCAWCGFEGSPATFSRISRISFDIDFLEVTTPDDTIGRHGGVAFCCQNAGTRWNNPNYTFDYLERDQVFRVGRGYTDGTQEWLAVVPDITDPGTEWAIDLLGTSMVFYVDGTEVARVRNAVHRSGYVGFWAYSNTGQEMYVDNVEITCSPYECSSISPDSISLRPWYPTPEFTVEIPFVLNRSEDYEVQVTTSNKDIALPAGADAEGNLNLLFPAGAGTLQTFQVECFDNPGTARLQINDTNPECERDVFAEIQVREPGAEEFSDSFEQPDGPPENWTVHNGEWSVTDGWLGNAPSTPQRPGEAWIWAGDSPIRFEMAESISFTLEFGPAPADAIGNHGGIMFYGTAPTERWAISGYDLDWLPNDDPYPRYRLIRYDNGVETLLAATSDPSITEPATEWRVEFEGDLISFSADGEFIFEVSDNTYREGYFGLWAYQNGSEVSVDEFVVGEGGPGPGPQFMRGDINADGKYDISDPILGLNHLFLNAPIPCFDAADVNDDGKFDIADPIFLLGYMFTGSAPPGEPFKTCGSDPTDEQPDLGCESFPACE